MYRPIGSTPLFIAPYAGVATTTFDLIEEDAVIARYRQTIPRLGVNVGVNLGARSDLRLGAYVGRSSATIETGDPGFPELSGKQTGAELAWRMDTQDSPVVPSGGVYSQIRLTHIAEAPELAVDVPFPYDTSLTQLSGSANQMWSVGARNRLFVYGALATSFDAAPLPPDEFALGAPFRLGAYRPGGVQGRSRLRRHGRIPQANRPPAGLPRRPGVRRCLAGERRCVR